MDTQTMIFKKKIKTSFYYFLGPGYWSYSSFKGNVKL